MRPFAQVSSRAQAQRVRRVAARALASFGLDGAGLRRVNLGYNATFRVDGGFALRVGVNSVKSAPEIRTEVAWIEALARDGVAKVAAPGRTLEGEAFAEVDAPELGRTAYAVVFDWVAGRTADGRFDRGLSLRLGEATAALHRHAESWSIPADGALKRFEDPLDGLPNHLAGGPHSEVFDEALRRAQAVLERLKDKPARPMHLDLHPENLLLAEGGLTLIDFDDMRAAWPILDAATTLFYLRMEDDADGLEAAYREGLGLGCDAADLEALVAGRALLLATDLFDSETAEFRAMAERYRETTAIRLRHYLGTGRFDPKVARF